MRIIYNKIIPFKGFLAINLFGILFVRKGKNLSEVAMNHETIHTKQMYELVFIFFYLWYGIEWIARLFQYGYCHRAYRNISFEREAYDNENNQEYCQKRKLYSFFKYLKK